MPANDIHTRPHTSPSKEALAVIVGSAFFAGVCLMAFMNRAEIGIIVSQFAVIWPIEQNRPEIIRIGLKIVFSGVVCATFALACWLTIFALRQDEATEPLAAPHPSDTPSTGVFPHPNGRFSPPAAPSLANHEDLPTTPHPAIALTPRAQTIMMPIKTQIEEEHATDKRRRAQEPGDQPATLTTNEMRLGATPNYLPGQTHEGQTPPISITITLLKKMTMSLHVPGTNHVYPVTLDDLNSKALQLIAYIAWHQGKKVNLGDMRNEVFGNDEMDTNQVQESLNSAKREIRRRISQAVERARNDFGADVFPANLDIFELAKKKYWLPAHCKVTDLAIIEEQHRLIEQAETSNHLVNSVPEAVYQACMTLINTYSGDFIEDLLVDDPYAFDPPTDSWAREPFTLFRDSYLDAIVYAAEYLRGMGNSTTTPQQQREYYAEAARLFAQGAIAACNRRVFDGMFDTKVSFSKGRRHGAHVLLSEQLIRRAIALYGKIGSTIVAKRVYSTYEQQMYFVSNNVWSPAPETLKDLEDALQQTGAYRFPDTIASPDDLSNTLVSAQSA